MKLKKLYELPEHQNIKLYFDDLIENKKDIVVIFDHVDGLYSYCWLEDKNKIIHIKATESFKKYKDGYKYVYVSGGEDNESN
jgi:hypothetical protein